MGFYIVLLIEYKVDHWIVYPKKNESKGHPNQELALDLTSEFKDTVIS